MSDDRHEQAPDSPSTEFAFTPPPPGCQQQARPGDSDGSAGNGLRSSLSLSPGESRLLKAASRRQVAAEWVASQTGLEVPHDSDTNFRQSLRDGVTLCRLLNTLRPGCVSKVIDGSLECTSPTGEVIQTFENVTNFIKGVQEFTGNSSTLSAADLEDAGERPQVADCILALHAWWQQQQQGAAPPVARSVSWGGTSTLGSDGGGNAARTSFGGTPAPTLCRPPSPNGSAASSPTADFSFTPHAATAVNRAGGRQGQDGLEYLMRTCNHMLKSTMGIPATPLPPPPRSATGIPSEIALDAVGPVLETVLQSLTAEYEKRLLAKDQEFKLGQEAQERMRRDIARLKQDVASWKEQAGAVKYLPAPSTEISDAEREAFEERLRIKEAEAAAEVARREAELQRVQEEAAQQAAEAEHQLTELSQKVQNYQDLNERYRQISEENRHLYNTVQDLRGNIRVFCRVRPRGTTGDHTASMVEAGDDGSLNVFNSKHNKWHTFKFDKVFGEGSIQEEVYMQTQPLIRSVLDGYNVCIFAYGQTGSGKTHTMSGTDIAEYANRGIYFRSLDDLFELNHQRHAEVEYNIAVQLLEIYNESLRDLLVSDVEARQQRSLQLVNSQRSGSNVPDAIQVPVTCTEDVLEVMDCGARNRAVAETRMNDRSSRSHQVLTVMVEGTNKITHARTHGCLHLIDLAGSERVGKSGAEGQQLLEAQHINKSLSALGNVMHALASKNAHVPFRDSKLTQLLQDSLSGQAKTMMFMHVAPEMSSVSETLSTLNFGKNVTEITLGAAKKNAESGAVFEAKEKALKMERDASAARSALAAEQQRNADLQSELEALRVQLARAASSPSASEDESNIRAYRPAATRHAAAAPQAAGGGLTPRSRLSLPPMPAAAHAASSGRQTPRGSAAAVPAATGGRQTPRGSAVAGSTGLTPRGSVPSGSITPRSGAVSTRPAQVSRLNLGGSGGSIGSGAKLAAAAVEDKRLSAPGGGGSGRLPPMAKLNLHNLQQRSETEENRSPLSARVSPAPGSLRVAAAAGAGHLTPRGGAASPGSSTSWLLDSDAGSGSEACSPSRLSDCSPAAAGAEEVDADAAFQLTMSPPRPMRQPVAASAAAAGPPRAGAAHPRLSLPVNRSSQSSADRQNPFRASLASGVRLPQGPSSRIPVPSPSPPPAALLQHPSGSMTARNTRNTSPALSSIPRGPMSARESPAETAARRAALQQRASAATASGSSMRRSVAAPDVGAASRLLSNSSLRRSTSGISEISSNGSLNSARGVRSSQALPSGGRRWA